MKSIQQLLEQEAFAIDYRSRFPNGKEDRAQSIHLQLQMYPHFFKTKSMHFPQP